MSTVEESIVSIIEESTSFIRRARHREQCLDMSLINDKVDQNIS